MDISLAGRRMEASEHTCESPLDRQRYGWLRFSPRRLQFLNSPRWLMFFMCSGGFAYNMSFGGIFPSIVSTLEKRFHFSNHQIGIIASGMDIVTVILYPFVSHFAEKSHKGRWIAAGLFLYGIGALIFVVPQFIVDPISGSNASIEGSAGYAAPICSTNKSTGTDPDCTHNDTAGWSKAPFYIFMLSKLILAIGKSTSHLAISYIDENVSQRTSPLYTTGIFVVAMFSIVVGFFVGAVTLKVHTDSYRIDTSQIKPGDPNWYGAWWIGFVATGVMLLLLVFPMLGFPRDLHSKSEKREKDVDESHRSPNKGKLANLASDFPKSIVLLLLNPVFALIALRNGIQMQFIAGFSTFMIVYLQQAHRMSASTAALSMAAAWVIPSLLGNIAGAIMIKVFRLPVRKFIILSILSSLFCVALFYCSLSYCPTMGVAGVNRRFDGSRIKKEVKPFIVTSCNAPCQCSLSKPYPICLPNDDLVYYSPCYAGCNHFDRNQDGSAIAAQCACANSSSDMPLWNPDNSLIAGRCPLPEYCNAKRIIYLTCLAIAAFIGGTGATPIVHVILRSVLFTQRTLAMGIHSILASILVIPGPIIFGYLMDKCCLLWTEQCNERGSCFLYNIEQMTAFILVYASAVAFVGTGMLVVALLLYKPPNDDPLYMRFRRRSNKLIQNREQSR